MATTTNLMTWEAFEQFFDDGMHHEIIAGEPITLPPPQLPHSNVAKRLYHALFSLEEKGLGEVFSEAGYKLSHRPPTWIQPDVSFLRPGRTGAKTGYLTGAPDLAAEVVSPSDRPGDLDRKVEALLAAGGTVVWVIFPDARRVRVFQRDGTSFSRGVNDTLSAPDLFPDWELPVSKLFED
jgi:Uma2 family endonuclease